MMRIYGWPEEEAFAFAMGEKPAEQSWCDIPVGALGLKILGNDRVIIVANKKEYSLKRTEKWTNITYGDILFISKKGLVRHLFKRGQSEIDLFLTNKCNSNCIMCPLPETVRKKDNYGHFRWLTDFINILPSDIPYINVTGGEPTFEVEHFLTIMRLLKNKFHCSEFQLLTNGRSFSDSVFLKDAIENMPSHTRIAVPLHSCNEIVHDSITQSKGSFRQTDRGIRNLLSQRQKVELRIVVSKENLYTVRETVGYIADYYPGIFVVNFIAMEMMGNAIKNKDRLWIDYDEVFSIIRESIIYLVSKGIDTQLYNFPLCAVDKGFWPLAARSISDYKIRYKEACSDCSVKSLCGGFFSSTMKVINPEVKVIREL